MIFDSFSNLNYAPDDDDCHNDDYYPDEDRDMDNYYNNKEYV